MVRVACASTQKANVTPDSATIRKNGTHPSNTISQTPQVAHTNQADYYLYYFVLGKCVTQQQWSILIRRIFICESMMRVADEI